MAHEYVFGLVGPSCADNARKLWNEEIRKQGIDGFFDFYRATNRAGLEQRLSEMFLLERRGYLIAAALQEDALELMDTLDDSAQREGRVDTVVNERGVLMGFFLGTKPSREHILRLWLPKD